MSNRATKTVKYTDRNRMQDYRTVFSTVEGKRVLNDLLMKHWLFGSTVTEDANPNVMLVREGERNVILEIMRCLNLKPSDLDQVRVTLTEQFFEEPDLKQ